MKRLSFRNDGAVRRIDGRREPHQCPLRKLGTCLMAAFLLAVVIGAVVSMWWAYPAGALNMNRSVPQKRWLYNKINTIHEVEEKVIDKYFRNQSNENVITPAVVDQITGVQPIELVLVGTTFTITVLLALARVI